jgi:EAL domain-containing protein (putative c-di-GMP-specific phosphodiesterase class I)
MHRLGFAMGAPEPTLLDADVEARGPTRFRVAQGPRAQAIARRRLEADLRRALERNAVSLQYQPRVALGNGEARGAEALLRWSDRRRGLVSPAQFIPVAERSNLIVELGGWALRRACAEAAGWPDLQVSVNASARQLVDGALLDQVAAALDESGLLPERLEIELTESLLIEVGAETLLVLSAIRDLGVGLSLDDFGTGYASLAVLKRLPLTAMKLDRSLIRGLPGDREDAAIVRAVVETGHALGLLVVAEGIETEEQRAFLSGIGCDEGQGYLFGHPLPPASLEWRRTA